MNIKVKISFIFYLVISIFGGFIKESFFLFLSLMIHEVGHIIMIKITNNKINELKLTIMGFFISLKSKKNKVSNLLLIYMGGIIFNILFYILFKSMNFLILAKFNLIILFVNLIPIYPLDGYNILYTLGSLLWEDEFLNDAFLLIGLISEAFVIFFFWIFKFPFLLVLIIIFSFNLIKKYLSVLRKRKNKFTLIYDANFELN